VTKDSNISFVKGKMATGSKKIMAKGKENHLALKQIANPVVL
jgi:hypothetical protein